MKRTLLFLFLILIFATKAFPQAGEKTSTIKGHVTNSENSEPVNEAQLVFPALKLITTSDAEGNFTFSDVPFGSYPLLVSGPGIKDDTIKVTVDKPLVDIGNVTVTINDKNAAQRSSQIPSPTLENNVGADDDNGVKTQSVSSTLTASRDPFLYTTSYIFGAYRFQARGYNRDQQQVFINGVEMNDLETGSATWTQWGGLNDVFRVRNNTYGLNPSERGFGGLSGVIYFDATAAAQRKQLRVSYSQSDRQYNERAMITWSSGLRTDGWAYTLSASGRIANEGYVPGTFYEGYSVFGGISKKWRKHIFSLSAFGTPTRRAKSSSSTGELYDLDGSHFYNPNWGYQDGVKRNARISKVFQPIFILSHEFTPSEKTKWNTGFSYQFGKGANSGLDWYNAADPRPDYYRYLPSWQTENNHPEAALELRNKIMNDPDHTLQLNWNRLYNDNYINTETIYNVNGIQGNNVTGHRSLYVLSNDVSYLKKWSFNVNVQHILTNHITLYSGINFIKQSDENYKQLLDLLGGDFFVNYNQFAAQQYIGNPNYYQNDLNNPNQIIKKGDKYGYDYINHFSKAWWWGQSIFNFNKVDFFLAANLGVSSFNREGLFKNGLFANASFGKSATQTFVTGGLKGGLTYKINGRNFLFVNAAYLQDAPDIDNTYISPRTRDFTVDNPTSQKSLSLEAGYLLKTRIFNARVSGYSTSMNDVTQIMRFYNDDPSYQTFVNYVMQGINMRFVGTELALSAKLNKSFSVTGVASIGQAFYSNRPKVSVYKDNDTTRNATSRQVYINNYYLPVGPQSAYSLGLEYTSKKYWYANINFNFFDRNYVAVNPDRLTPQTVDLVTPGSEQWHQILDQEKLPSAFTVDLFAGKSFLLSRYSKKIPRGTLLYINVGVNNVLNNTNIITGGFEQLRYDFIDKDPSRFPSKYFYGFGRTFFVNLSIRL